MSEVLVDTERKWLEYGAEYDWTPPRKAARIYRLPVIRHVRYAYTALLVERHYKYWAAIGAARSGYDSWVLFGIFHGWV
jgi:hypothetical protein